MSDETERPWRCSARHWFGVYGFVGVRAPICARCGAPNPRWNERDREAYEDAIAMKARWAEGIYP